VATYARLNIEFDSYDGESMVPQNRMDDAAKILSEKGITEDSDGAVIADLTRYNKKLGKCVLVKKDGTSLYLTRVRCLFLSSQSLQSIDHW
jgi:arginyl-tRNA synthetase